MKKLVILAMLMASGNLAFAQNNEPNEFRQIINKDSMPSLPPDMKFNPNDSTRKGRPGPPPDGMRPGRPGNGKPGGPPPGGAPGQNVSAESKVSENGYGQTSGNKEFNGNKFTSDNAEENAIQVKGGMVSLINCDIKKMGADSDNGDGTSFYGTNAAVLATNSGTVNIDGGIITTSAVGANGIVAYGGTVNATDLAIVCKKNLSRGIHATGGGTINAKKLNLSTEGNNSSVIATDRGGGTVNVDGGNYKTSGGDCAVCYSTGTINVNNITGLSEKGEVAVIEGDNVININNCDMTSGDNRRGMMILQSGSGDAEGFNGKINVSGGKITLTSSEAPLIEITTSTKGTVTLKDVKLTVPSGVLMKVDYNTRWNTTNPVAYLNLTTESSYEYKGDIVVDEYGTANVNVGNNVTWTGAFDKEDTGKETSAVIDGVWNLTNDSNVDTLTLNQGAVVNANGHQLNFKTLNENGEAKINK